ncbi:MAG TPA: alpha/beta hydrolase [Acidimicrobiales bacterium]|nr:alpha/beta hydrolase [Acidimicrobiales bacterium]
MTGSVNARYVCIKAFSETDQTEDLKAIDAPTLVVHGDDDQVAPIADALLLTIKLLKKGRSRCIRGFPHGVCTMCTSVPRHELTRWILHLNPQRSCRSTTNRKSSIRSSRRPGNDGSYFLAAS